jgi:hypothetical protein
MKKLHASMALIALVLASCVSGGSVTRTPQGGYHLNAPYTLFGDQEGVVADITTREGDHFKFAAKKQSGTRGFIAWMKTKLGLGLADTAAGTQHAQIGADRDVALGAQGVEKFKAGEETKKTLGTFVPPPTQ